MRVAKAITISDAERRTLQKWARGRSTPARLILRAKIVLAAADSKLNKEIASDLGTSLRTIKAHRAHVMSKMQVASVAQLVGVAARLKDRL